MPEWMNYAMKDLARKNKRSVSAQIEVLVEEQLTRMGYKSPEYQSTMTGQDQSGKMAIAG
jgi:hypothetical protein